MGVSLDRNVSLGLDSVRTLPSIRPERVLTDWMRSQQS
jgi:hypothetical protein